MFHAGQWIDDQYLVLESQCDYFWLQYVVQDRISENVFVVKRFSDLVLRDKSVPGRFGEAAKTWINVGERDELLSAFMVKEYDEVPHLFVEYVEGPTLADILASRAGKALPLKQIVGLMQQLVRGLTFLHNASMLGPAGNVIHGGLRPQAILTKEGNVKIADIGLMPVLRQSNGMANVDRLLDQSCYLAPEQRDDPARADELTDIYSFGAVLYEAATGAAPIAPNVSGDPLQDFFAVPVSPRLRNRSCPQWLDEVILKCMAVEPENRFQSFNQIESLLSEVLKTAPIPHEKMDVGDSPEEVSRVARVRGIAKKESRRLNHYYLGVEHLMLGLLADEESLVLSCLGDQKPASQLQAELLGRLPKGEGPWYWEGIIKTPRYASIMSRARKNQRSYGHERMLPQHVLLAILEEGRSIPVRVLQEMGFDIEAAARALRRELKKSPSGLFGPGAEAHFGKLARKVARRKHVPDAIPVLGREAELREAAHSLVDEKKSVLLAGPPGVGKTAFIQELEDRLSQSSSGVAFGGIYELKKADLFMNFQERDITAAGFQDLLLKTIGEHAILLIDDIDMFLGIGAQIRLGFLAEILEDFLESHKLKVIATTTPKGLDSCETVSGRTLSLFRVIRLDEPPQEMMLEILAAAKDVLEKKHSLVIEDEALEASLGVLPVDLAFPAAAIEALERACLISRLSTKSGGDICVDAQKVKESLDNRSEA